jgi:hypothetical protein
MARRLRENLRANLGGRRRRAAARHYATWRRCSRRDVCCHLAASPLLYVPPFLATLLAAASAGSRLSGAGSADSLRSGAWRSALLNVKRHDAFAALPGDINIAPRHYRER